METPISERELLDRLRELAEAARDREPSAEVEGQLVRAFVESHAAPPARHVYWPLVAAAAVVLVSLTPVMMLRTTYAPASPPLRAPAVATQDPLEGFVPVPGAGALPQLESASIVRYELPLSVLPQYGVEIVPDAARRSVEADLLIGQDGYARAIRLVTD